MVNSIDYSFYSINLDYLKYLNKIDSEVYYSNSYKNNVKPFVGIIVGIGEYHYFIPLSSAKAKHIKMKNVSNEHFLIYEKINSNKEVPGKIYKKNSPTTSLHILSILDIKKMIPVPKGKYEKIEFDKITDDKYKDLCKKEYKFCLSIKNKVLKKVEKLYIDQKEKGIKRKGVCDFSKLEEAMLKWE